MRDALRFAGLGLVVLLAGCSERQEPPAPVDTPAASTAPAGRVDYDAALAAPGRLVGDIEQDAQRKPAEVLAFFGVQPGMAVLDLWSGGGYYTELLAAVVGPAGRVVAHNNTPYLTEAADELAQRFADPQRLATVERLTAENNALELPPARFDFVLLSAVYHDVYFVNESTGWAEIDGPALLAEISPA